MAEWLRRELANLDTLVRFQLPTPNFDESLKTEYRISRMRKWQCMQIGEASGL